MKCEPCDEPPLAVDHVGCCSQACVSFDECLECSYDNYWYCIDQVLLMEV